MASFFKYPLGEIFLLGYEKDCIFFPLNKEHMSQVFAFQENISIMGPAP